jgi:uncharacterized protein
MTWKRIKKWLLTLAIIYIAGGIALYLLQDRILFHPVQLKKDHYYAFADPHEDISIPINNEENLSLVRFLRLDSTDRGIVLYFHGNKKNISWYAKYPSYFTRHGYEVIMIDYPGFGKSTGSFNEQTLYDWSEHVYKLARSRYPADSIIIYGKSMGTGIAAHLASIHDCQRLILETPYHDFPSVVKHYLPIYPVDWMIHYKLPTYRYLPNVKAPITIFHGTKDRVITYRNAKRLQPLLKQGDEFVTIKGGRHNNLYDFEEVVGKIDSVLRH